MLQLAADDGRLPDGVFADDIGGAVDPADTDYPEERPGWYFDLATYLLSEQRAGGHWPDGVWGQEDLSTAWACLALERSLGGACQDLDEDGLCGLEDNCRTRFNPDQADTDGDGVGDACDRCPHRPDRGQEDSDGDGIGDACDKHPECDASRATAEVCDGVDNDCDGATDELDSDEPCNTGLPGACAIGRPACLGRLLGCVPHGVGEAVEVCNLEDDDCDGAIDEGVRNACGRCGPAPPGGCDDSADPCEEGGCEPSCAQRSCVGGQACFGGRCKPDPCGGVHCPEDQLCIDGVCVDEPCRPDGCQEDGDMCAVGRGCGEDLCVGIRCARLERCETRCTPDGCGPRCVADWYGVGDLVGPLGGADEAEDGASGASGREASPPLSEAPAPHGASSPGTPPMRGETAPDAPGSSSRRPAACASAPGQTGRRAVVEALLRRR